MFKGLILAVLVGSASFGQQPNHYSDRKSWLWRPAGHDACAVELTTTVIAADGRLTRETWAADPKEPIDCFYVYPTVSTDPTPNSDIIADDAERNVVCSNSLGCQRSIWRARATFSNVVMRRSTCFSVWAAVQEIRSRFWAAAGRSTGLI